MAYKYESCPLSFKTKIKSLGWKLSELLLISTWRKSSTSSSPSTSTWVLRSRTKSLTESWNEQALTYYVKVLRALDLLGSVTMEINALAYLKKHWL